ncbi:MAG: polysaccharide deacetylase family protein [Firmicutes bacterium]|nr:polysaccharide deacetylase family protein [Bacillota bacterium]
MARRVFFLSVALRPVLRLGLWALALLVAAAAQRWGNEPVIPAQTVPAVNRLDPLKPVYSVPVTSRWVALAVNVDWGEEYLPAMLSEFRKRGIRVTFFPTGRFAEIRPDLIRAMVDGGHEIGNHGYRHDHPIALSDAALKDLIVRNQELLRQVAGVTTRLFAPPYGEVDPRVVRIAASTDHWTIMWTVDTVDWRRPPPETIVRRVLSRVQPGAIVLMHPTEPTVAALPALLDTLTAGGWQVVPVGQLLTAGLSLEPGA